jgi:hypothetical protein
MMHTAGQEIPNFSLPVSVGNAVVTASYLLIKAAIDHDLWGKVAEEDRKTLAIRLRCCLNITCVVKHCKDQSDAIYQSISTKASANRRAKTSVIGILAAYTAIVEMELARPGQRKGRLELLTEAQQEGG